MRPNELIADPCNLCRTERQRNDLVRRRLQLASQPALRRLLKVAVEIATSRTALCQSLTLRQEGPGPLLTLALNQHSPASTHTPLSLSPSLPAVSAFRPSGPLLPSSGLRSTSRRPHLACCGCRQPACDAARRALPAASTSLLVAVRLARSDDLLPSRRPNTARSATLSGHNHGTIRQVEVQRGGPPRNARYRPAISPPQTATEPFSTWVSPSSTDAHCSKGRVRCPVRGYLTEKNARPLISEPVNILLESLDASVACRPFRLTVAAPPP